ncbi:MAG: histidine--tRNA ligase [Actinomycetota bacterium]|nr:histidine--tRNA ligase [Actinomycetota bacterium]
MAQLQAPKGVPEYFPPRSSAFLAVREALAKPAQLAGYGYVELPIFEDTALYVRGVGESTDVVAKEMYTFEDRGGRSLSLRPEGTAGVMRLVIEHGLDRGPLPVKVWYAGPFFRAERPQQGRYRQLQQVGIEAIGSMDPAVDAEVIAIADAGFRSLGLQQFTLQLTSLGCAECRPAYRALLQDFLAKLDLDGPTKERAALNPLRVLDDKRPEVQALLVGAPYMVDHLCADCGLHYDKVREHLQTLDVQWTESPSLVRGLDYYTRTAFEFTHALLGAQSGIGGGGRYDGLMESLGGQDLSGIGFGIGTDRTLLACEAELLQVGAATLIDVFAIPMGSQAKEQLIALGAQLRRDGIRFDLAFGDRGLKGAMKAADRSGAPWVLVLGEHELADGTVVIRDMSRGEQETVPWESVQPILMQRISDQNMQNTEGAHS